MILGQETQPTPCRERVPEPRLDSFYESQRNQTTVMLDLPRSTCGEAYGMRITFHHAGREMRKPSEITLSFVHVFCPPNDVKAACFDFTMVLDEIRLPLGKLIGTGMGVIYDTEGSWSHRYVTVRMETFLQIVKARKVNIVIGQKSFYLSKRYKEAMRRLADSLEAAS